MRSFFATPDHPDGRAYGWTRTEPDHQLWRYGAAFLVLPGIGRINYQGTGRGDLHLNVEWSVRTKYRFGFGASVKVGTNSSEQDIAIALHALGINLYLSTEQLIPRRWLRPYQDESRVTGFTIAKDHIEWQVWYPRDTHTAGTPMWRYFYAPWDRLLFGQSTVTKEIDDEGTTVIPMPERTYDATYKVERITSRWPTRLGRLRPSTIHYRVDLNPLDPVPIPGKGESSWDCDDDAMYGQSSAGRSVETAVGDFIASALSTRKRHGGQAMSIPTTTTPGQP